MWQLGGDTHAPTSRSMRQLCWECREQATAPTVAVAPAANSAGDVLAQAYDVVRDYESRNV